MSKHEEKWITRKLKLERDVLQHGQKIVAQTNSNGVWVAVDGKDHFSGKPYRTEYVSPEVLFGGLEAWNAGAYVQVALSFYSAADREFIKTALTPDFFGSEDDD